MLVARTQTLDQRAAILSGLLWRNRLVGVLRIAVPAVGVAAFLVLIGQMWLTSIARQYGVSGIRIDRGQLVVETPQYSETGEDGSRYLVTAEAARTPLDNPNSIAMTSPDLLFERPGKAPFHAVADNATVDTSTHLVTIPGITRGFGRNTLVLSARRGLNPLAVLLALSKPRFRRQIRTSGFFHPTQRANAAFVRRFARATTDPSAVAR